MKAAGVVGRLAFERIAPFESTALPSGSASAEPFAVKMGRLSSELSKSEHLLARSIQLWTEACDSANQAWISVDAANMQVVSISSLLHQAVAETPPFNSSWLPGLETIQPHDLSDEEKSAIGNFRGSAAIELMAEIRAASSRIAFAHATAISSNEEIEAQRARQRGQTHSLKESQRAVQEQAAAMRRVRHALGEDSHHADGQGQASSGCKGKSKALQPRRPGPLLSTSTAQTSPSSAAQSRSAYPGKGYEPAISPIEERDESEDANRWDRTPEETPVEVEPNSDEMLGIPPHWG